MIVDEGEVSVEKEGRKNRIIGGMYEYFIQRVARLDGTNIFKKGRGDI